MGKHDGRFAPELPLREKLEAEIERLIALCDTLDGEADAETDADSEPDDPPECWLGWGEDESRSGYLSAGFHDLEEQHDREPDEYDEPGDEVLQ